MPINYICNCCLYWLGGSNIEQWTRIRPNTNDVNDKESTVYRRSVLLFNTWPCHAPPPLDILDSPPSGTIKYCAKHGISSEACQHHTEWIPHIIPSYTTDSHESRVRMKIGLLGSADRRGGLDRYINVFAPRSIKKALLSKEGESASFAISLVP